MTFNKSYKRNKDIVESKKSKGLRVFLTILYFVQVVLTTFPFMWGPDEKGNPKQLTAFQIAIQPDGYQGAAEIKLAIIFGILVLFPAVCFFFCLLDKSALKNFISFACCLVCACIITFGIGGMIATGALIALLLYIFILFISTASLISQITPDKTEE